MAWSRRGAVAIKQILLSVFVSIQSMILGVSNPIENEPGYKMNFDKGTATEYRNRVQCMTVLYAMLFWLESEKAKKSVWKDISARYWMHNGKLVLDGAEQYIVAQL
jgi:hypothetical protein